MSECNHDCSECQVSDCGERQGIPVEPANEMSDIKKVIGIVSGKGGVGKSLVTSMLAVSATRWGYRTAVLDADITGPSIPKMFGIDKKATSDGLFIYPVQSGKGTEIMSVNLVLENETDPVIWRGPIIGNTVKQFWTDVAWGDIDFMFIDMPPGTGDVPLTVFQSLPVDGIIIVASPQELVGMIVEKAVNMAAMMNIPIIGIVENMSYLKCPDCGKEIKVFGESGVDEIAKAHGMEVLAKLPIDPKLAGLCDKGEIENFEDEWFDGIKPHLLNLIEKE